MLTAIGVITFIGAIICGCFAIAAPFLKIDVTDAENTCLSEKKDCERMRKALRYFPIVPAVLLIALLVMISLL